MKKLPACKTYPKSGMSVAPHQRQKFNCFIKVANMMADDYLKCDPNVVMDGMKWIAVAEFGERHPLNFHWDKLLTDQLWFMYVLCVIAEEYLGLNPKDTGLLPAKQAESNFWKNFATKTGIQVVIV